MGFLLPDILSQMIAVNQDELALTGGCVQGCPPPTSPEEPRKPKRTPLRRAELSLSSTPPQNETPDYDHQVWLREITEGFAVVLANLGDTAPPPTRGGLHYTFQEADLVKKFGPAPAPPGPPNKHAAAAQRDDPPAPSWCGNTNFGRTAPRQAPAPAPSGSLREHSSALVLVDVWSGKEVAFGGQAPGCTVSVSELGATSAAFYVLRKRKSAGGGDHVAGGAEEEEEGHPKNFARVGGLRGGAGSGTADVEGAADVEEGIVEIQL